MKHPILAAAIAAAALVQPVLAQTPASGPVAPMAAGEYMNHAPAGMTELGPAVGAKAPAISGTTQTGAPSTFASLKGQKGLVVAFVRSADWCPFCKGQLKDLNTVAADLKATGYPLVSLSYDKVETLKTFSDANALTYTMISDPESKVIDAFKLRNMEMAGKGRFDGIPHPAIFVIGADGIVKAKFYEDNYRVRPPSKIVLEAVRKLG